MTKGEETPGTLVVRVALRANNEQKSLKTQNREEGELNTKAPSSRGSSVTESKKDN